MNSFQDGINYGLPKLGYDKIMDNQRRVVVLSKLYMWLVEMSFIITYVAPTGSGKSLIFQIEPVNFISHASR